MTDMILFTGHKRVIIKSDGESPIKALKEAVKNSSEFNLGVEVSPVGDSSQRRNREGHKDSARPGENIKECA